MGLREVQATAISMRNRGASRESIFEYVLSMAQRLGARLEGDENSFMVRLSTGATVIFSGGGYSYCGWSRMPC